MQIRALKHSDLESVLHFTDREIGAGYFSFEQLEMIYEASKSNGFVSSFVLVDEKDRIFGVRLTLMPGRWLKKDPSQAPHPESWRVPYERAGYFQGLFVNESVRSAGWGSKLSMASLEALRAAGAQAVVCHSWNESPQNSSRRYLGSMQFEPVIEIPHFWKVLDYECTRCLKPPCLCTATEIIRYL